MAMNYDNDREVTYEIVEEIGVIASQPTGWTKELNVVSWNGGQAKYDIREWSPYHDRMSRGITLNEQEMRMIVDLLKRRKRNARRVGTNARGDRDFAPRPEERESIETASPPQNGDAGDNAIAYSAREAQPEGQSPSPEDDEAWDAMENNSPEEEDREQEIAS